jgi:hypothetical protein
MLYLLLLLLLLHCICKRPRFVKRNVCDVD